MADDRKCDRCSKSFIVLVELEGEPRWFLCIRCYREGFRTEAEEHAQRHG
ncbi:MAG TPA: hypothetical protein VGM94_00675 [Galbitalea sp.]|jgi:hypothetical protein